MAENRKVCDLFLACVNLSFISSLGMIKKVKKGKVAVFTCGLDIAQTETKGTVLLKNADEMLNFTRGEEKHLEKVWSVHFTILLLVLILHLGRSSKRSPTPVSK